MQRSQFVLRTGLVCHTRVVSTLCACREMLGVISVHLCTCVLGSIAAASRDQGNWVNVEKKVKAYK